MSFLPLYLHSLSLSVFPPLSPSLYVYLFLCLFLFVTLSPLLCFYSLDCCCCRIACCRRSCCCCTAAAAAVDACCLFSPTFAVPYFPHSPTLSSSPSALIENSIWKYLPSFLMLLPLAPSLAQLQWQMTVKEGV